MAGPINNGGNNFGKKLGNAASKARQRANNGKNYDVMNPEAENPNVKAAKKNIAKAARKAAKQVGKAIGKAVKALVKALLKAGWVGIVILVVLILALIITAIITALNTMPGMMRAKLAQLFKIDIGNWFMNGAVASLKDDYSDIIDVANYIESMNYSLIGDGFVTPMLNVMEENVYTVSEVLERNPDYVHRVGVDGKEHFYDVEFDIDGLDEAEARRIDESHRIAIRYYDSIGRIIDNLTGDPVSTGGNDEYQDEYGIIRSTNDAGGNDRGKIVRVAENGKKNYRLLRSYLLSNYRIYTLKNADETFLKDLARIYRERFGGNQDAWATGLVKLYVANGGIASNHWWWGEGGIGSIAQMTETSLILRKGYFNLPIEFSIQGWSPRYGMSLDFLIALHLGTGAPDLVYAMLQNFDTEVQVYLDDVGDSTIEARYVDPKVIVPAPEGVSINMIQTGLSDYNWGINGFFINDAGATQWINGTFLTRGACAELFKKIDLLKSPDTCTYSVTDYVIIDITGGRDTIPYPDFWDYFRTGSNIHYGELEGVDVLQKLYGYNDTDLEKIDYNMMVDGGTGYHRAYNRETSLMSYKLEHELGYMDEIDYTTAHDEALADRDRIRGSLSECWNMVSAEIGTQTDVADPEPQLNGKVYEIIMDKEEADWDVFLDSEDDVPPQGVLPPEDVLNGNVSSDNESSLKYLSYIYTVYETGVVNPDGTVQKYEDGGVPIDDGEEYELEVGRFTYGHARESETEFENYDIDRSRPTYTVAIFYSQDESGNEKFELKRIPDTPVEITDDYDPADPLIIDWVREDASDSQIVYRATYWELIDWGEILDPENRNWAGPSVTINIYGESIGVLYQFGRTDLTNTEEYNVSRNAEGNVYIEYSLEEIRDAYENRHATLQTEKILRDILYINVAVREKTIEELKADGVLDENGNPTGDHGRCSEEARGPNGDKFKRTCKQCQKYIKAVTAALAEVSDPDYKAYTPYIARVVGSWFRDTYFIIPVEADAAIKEYADDGNREKMRYEILDEDGEVIEVIEEKVANGVNRSEFNAENTYGMDVKFVKVDEEYLGDSGEYWTSYTTKKVIIDGVEQDTGEYQLYVLKADGITSETTMEEFLETGEIDHKQVCEPYGSISTEEELAAAKEKAEEDGWAFVKRTEIYDFNDFINKHTIWKDSSTVDRINAQEILWSAYSFDSNGLVRPWARVARSEENHRVNDLYDIIYMFEEETMESGIFYQVSTTNNITQVEDAERGETNALIKYLFKYRKFYLYDGSETTAVAIAHDKQRILYGYDYYVAQGYDSEDKYYNNKKIKDTYSIRDAEGRYSTENLTGGENFYHYRGLLDTAENGNKGVLRTLYGDNWKEQIKNLLKLYGRSALRQSYGWNTDTDYIDDEDLASQWLDWQLDMYYMDKYDVDIREYYHVNFNILRLNYDPRDPELIGNVQITKSSLNVFSILENTGSIDAEYAYRDFKELIVELDYFNRDELSTKIQGVFTWLLPNISPAGWPVRPWDKQDVDYGTLIQSKATYDALEGVDSGESSEEDEFESTIFWIGDSWISQLESDNSVSRKKSPDSYFYGAGNAANAISSYDAIKGQIEGQDSVSVIVVLFGINDPDEDGDVQNLMIKLHGDFPDIPVVALKASHIGTDYMGDKEAYNTEIDEYNNRMKSFCVQNGLSFADWSTSGVWDSDGYLRETEAGGRMIQTRSTTMKNWYKNAVAAIKGAKGGKAKFTGYEAGEPVVSPVTGKILEIGTHERLNVYTGQMEEVEFITIQVMDCEDYFEASRIGNVDQREAESEYGYTTRTQYSLAQALDLFYREYSDVCLDDPHKGYTITIDGFDVDLLCLEEGESARSLSGDALKERLNDGKYEQNEVYALYNSEEMAKREEIEQAKDDAPFFINCRETNAYPVEGYVGDPTSTAGYYIKEGKYLGRTIEPNASAASGSPGIPSPTGTVPSVPSTPETGERDYSAFEDVPGDYMRIIIKDSDYAIVDDVERFFNIP